MWSPTWPSGVRWHRCDPAGQPESRSRMIRNLATTSCMQWSITLPNTFTSGQPRLHADRALPRHREDRTRSRLGCGQVDPPRPTKNVAASKACSAGHPPPSDITYRQDDRVVAQPPTHQFLRSRNSKGPAAGGTPVSERGLEPPRAQSSLGPQPSASTNSATPT